MSASNNHSNQLISSRRRFLQTAVAGLAAPYVLQSNGLIIGKAQAATLPAVAEKDAVIAFGHSGPISDGGWTWKHHLGLEALKKTYPAAKYIEVESVPTSADATRTFRQFVSQGANLVFVSSYYGEFLSSVSDAAPKVAFFENYGRHLTNNMSGYWIEHWVPSYVIGVTAGLLTKSNKLGYVGSMPIPAIYESVNAFHLGARSVNPKVQTQVININSWFDPQAAAQAGSALIQGGADYLFGFMDEAAYLNVAQKAGVWASMWNADMRASGPDSYVSAVIVDWREFYLDQMRKLLAGEWTGSQDFLLKPGTGVDRDAWGAKVPSEVSKQADDVRAKLLNGTLNPWKGEMRDAKGKVRIKAGESLQPFGWNWALEGVSGFPDA
jgi:basic membrane protein A